MHIYGITHKSIYETYRRVHILLGLTGKPILYIIFPPAEGAIQSGLFLRSRDLGKPSSFLLLAAHLLIGSSFSQKFNFSTLISISTVHFIILSSSVCFYLESCFTKSKFAALCGILLAGFMQSKNLELLSFVLCCFSVP